jgi:hypothetical protein
MNILRMISQLLLRWIAGHINKTVRAVASEWPLMCMQVLLISILFHKADSKLRALYSGTLESYGTLKIRKLGVQG